MLFLSFIVNNPLAPIFPMVFDLSSHDPGFVVWVWFYEPPSFVWNGERRRAQVDYSLTLTH